MKRITPALTAALLIAAGCEATPTPPAPGSATAPASTPEAGTPEAPTPGYEPPAPGTIVVERHPDGTLETSRVLGSEGYALTMLRDGERFARVPFCFACEAPPDQGTGAAQYRALWPLEVGKSAAFRQGRASDGAVRLHEVSVTGTETVETDFGPVETLVIEETITAEGAPQITRRQWFSPQLGWAVRSEWQAPDDGSGSWVLAGIALPR